MTETCKIRYDAIHFIGIAVCILQIDKAKRANKKASANEEALLCSTIHVVCC
jgi:hypothetical protein